MTYRYHSVRCRHGFDRSIVPCPGCGDLAAIEREEAAYQRAREVRRVQRRRAGIIGAGEQVVAYRGRAAR
jgi:hypothetical protein